MVQSRNEVSRRAFVGAAAGAAAAAGVAPFFIVPRHCVAQSGRRPPSETIRLAGIGVGGQGGGDLNELARDSGVKVVALCDADTKRGEGSFARWPEAKRFRDFRKMYDEAADDFDAVLVATPDHTHAVAVMAAIKRRKHVYCEKPLAHSVWEVRELVRAARQYDVVTQMGNQGHSSESIRLFSEMIADGAIGRVHTIHAACSAVNTGMGSLEKVATERPPVPEHLDWDLWLGPAQFRPYHRAYCPGSWRGWAPFGTGTIGDWACHVIDPVFWALDLGSPVSVKCTAQGYDPAKHADVFPRGNRLTYKFAASGKRGPVTLEWYDGSEKLPRPEVLEPEVKPVDTGAVVYGDKGVIMYGSHGAGGVRIIPESKRKEYKRPAPTLPRVKGGHHQDFLNAIREGRKASSDFSYGGPLTEIAMLGVIATKLLGQELRWDGKAGRFTNGAAANALIKPEFRKGWTL